jgi:hypothetical protein
MILSMCDNYWREAMPVSVLLHEFESIQWALRSLSIRDDERHGSQLVGTKMPYHFRHGAV